MDDARRDTIVALRSLRKAPAFTLVAVLTLAIGIAAVAAMFSAVDGILLRPLPVDDDSRLVLIRKELRQDGTLAPLGHSDVVSFERSGPAEAVAGVQYDGAFPWVVVHGERALTMMGTSVSGTFFQVLGTRPALGRLLEPGDAIEGAEPVVVLSYSVWRRAFGGDPGVLGARLRVGGEPATIVGVAPPDLEYPAGVELWSPLAPMLLPNGGELQAFSLLARLRSGRTVAEAEAAASTMLRAQEALLPAGAPRGFHARAEPLRDAIVGSARLPLLATGAAVGLVFTAVILNLAVLVVLRGIDRAPEIRLRSMLGARPDRLARQLLAETGVIAVAAGIIGLVLASWSVRGVSLLASESLPRITNLKVDTGTLVLAGTLAAVVSVLLSFGPGLHQVRSALRPNESGQRHARLRDGLVAAQIALAFVVAAGAGLVVKSYVRMQQVDLGFNADGLTLVRVAAGDGSAQRDQATLGEVTTRLQAIPAIVRATPVLVAPFAGRGGWDAFVTVAGQDATRAAANPGLNFEAIGPGYFATLQLPVLRGRPIDERDRRGGDPVVVVSEGMARRLWSREDVLGERLKFGGPDAAGPWHTVVGVVADSRYRDLLLPPPTVYVSLAQTDHEPGWLIVRTRGQFVDVRRLVTSVLEEAAPGSFVLSTTPLRDLLAGPLARPRFITALLGAFAILAVGLAALGIYGSMASMVARRRREIAVRMALGSTRGGIRRLVVARGLGIAMVGLGSGLLLALVATRGLRSMLFGVAPLDGAVLLATGILLGGVVTLACYFPSRRAAAVSPSSALRAD